MAGSASLAIPRGVRRAAPPARRQANPERPARPAVPLARGLRGRQRRRWLLVSPRAGSSSRPLRRGRTGLPGAATQGEAGAGGRASPAGTQWGRGIPPSRASAAPGGWRLLSRSWEESTRPELVLTKERTFPLTCGYAGAGNTQERRVRRTMAPRKMRGKRGAAERGVNHRTLNCTSSPGVGCGWEDCRRREPTQVKEKRPDR